jgi:hypothetical protein
MQEPPKPRRRIEATFEISADSWKGLTSRLHNLIYELDGGHWSGNGGISAGWESSMTVNFDEDESITHESWEQSLTEWLEWKRAQDAKAA